MARELAYINPKLLVWAREKSGRGPADLASVAGVPVERYLAWESGAEYPTLAKMRLIAHRLKRPLAFFYLAELPQGFSPIHDYRTLSDAPSAPMSPELLLAIRRAQYRRLIAIDLAEELGEMPERPDFEIPAGGLSASEFAKRLRKWLGVSLEEQQSWRGDKYEAKRTWQERIESRGILVFQAESVSVDEMRGFGISDRPMPAIVTNSSDTVQARIFTMLHELCHVLQSEGGVCTPSNVADNNVGEVYCNRVAGEALVPQDEILAEISPTHRGNEWTEQDLRRLSNRFCVSREVVLRRLLDLGRTTPAFYQSERERFIRDFEAGRRRQMTAESFPRDMALLTRANIGPPFVRLVLSAMRTDLITTRDASDYLGLRSKHFDRLEELVW